MAQKRRVFYEPIPEYMQRLSMMGARFIDGNDGTGAAGGSDGGSNGDGGSNEQAGSNDSGSSNDDGGKPPWGSESEFDAETAWTLIKNLRGDNEKLKAERDKAIGDLGAKDSQIEELQATVQLTDDAVKTKEKDLSDLQTLRTKERLLYTAGLDPKYVSQVVGDDEDAWKASIDNLLELRGKGAQDGAPNPAQAAGQQPAPSQDETAKEFFGL